jgi:hypothetical protein
MTKIGTLPVVDPDLDADLDHGDDDPKYSHYVKKDDIMRSNVEGTPATALCGKKWFPNRDPEKYPICPRCEEMMGMLRAMD